MKAILVAALLFIASIAAVWFAFAEFGWAYSICANREHKHLEVSLFLFGAGIAAFAAAIAVFSRRDQGEQSEGRR